MNDAEGIAAVTGRDVAALGRAQTRGEDIRPPHRRGEPDRLPVTAVCEAINDRIRYGDRATFEA